MKYIIEFEDEPCMREGGLNFYKCIQAPWWGLREEVIKYLTPYEPERKNGHWFINSDGYYPYCSECRTEPSSGHMTDFCPNCGADMRGTKND